MKPFKFTMQSLLDFRDFQLDQEKNVLADLRHKKHLVEMELKSLEDLYEIRKKSYSEKYVAGLHVEDLLYYESYFQFFHKERKTLIFKINEAEKVIVRQMHKVMELNKSTKSLENLKEKRFEEHQKKEARRNEIFIEEFVSNQITMNKE